MQGPGVVSAALVAVVLVVLASITATAAVAAADGAGRRNRTAGIRIPSVMRSPATWTAGHLAARPPILSGSKLSGTLAVLSVALTPYGVLYFAALAASVLALLGGVGYGTYAARKAALTVAHDPRQPAD